MTRQPLDLHHEPLPTPMHKRYPLMAACAALTLLPALALAQNATDQLQRQFPDQARRGVLRVTAPPDILLDGKPDRLSPGARIRSIDRRIVMAEYNGSPYRYWQVSFQAYQDLPPFRLPRKQARCAPAPERTRAIPSLRSRRCPRSAQPARRRITD